MKPLSGAGFADLRVASSHILHLLSWGSQQLELAEALRPRWTAEQLLSHRLACKSVELYLEPPPVTAEQAIRFRADVAARANGMPLQYLMGSAGFYGREFLVGPGVFIPRPETEVLIDTTIEVLRRQPGFAVRGRPQRGRPLESSASLSRFSEWGRSIWGHTGFFRRPVCPQMERPLFRGSGNHACSASDAGEFLPLPLPSVIDVGTGSGAIAITLALECPGIRVRAIDKSPTALSFARRNAVRYGCEISYIEGDLLEPLAPNSVDVIVANLPYLNSDEATVWPRELQWEPWLALDGGQSGASLIQKLIGQAGSVLKQHGKLFLEIGAGQSEQIRPCAQAHGFRVDRVVPDLAGLERVMVLWKN